MLEMCLGIMVTLKYATDQHPPQSLKLMRPKIIVPIRDWCTYRCVKRLHSGSYVTPFLVSLTLHYLHLCFVAGMSEALIYHFKMLLNISFNRSNIFSQMSKPAEAKTSASSDYKFEFVPILNWRNHLFFSHKNIHSDQIKNVHAYSTL